MPRQPLPADQVRKTRLTLYLTQAEYDALHEAAARERRDMTEVVRQALDDYQARLNVPVTSWKQSEERRIMGAQSAELEGYACENAHAFWAHRQARVEVHQCPVCRSLKLERTWNGVITRPRPKAERE